MRYLAALLLVGCASGQATITPSDGDISMLPDAESPADAQPDAEPHVPDDAAPDAPPDAPPAVPPDAAMPDAYVCQVMTMQLLQNPAFDLTPVGTGWVLQPIDPSVQMINDIHGATEHSVPYKAWLGGAAGVDLGKTSITDMLYQDVAVPAGTTQLRLTGYYWVATNETTTTTAYDTAQVALVETNATPIETVLSLSNLTTTSSWTAIDKTFAMPQAGKTVRLRFTSTNDVTNHTNFFFDTLALTATYCQ